MRPGPGRDPSGRAPRADASDEVLVNVEEDRDGNENEGDEEDDNFMSMQLWHEVGDETWMMQRSGASPDPIFGMLMETFAVALSKMGGTGAQGDCHPHVEMLRSRLGSAKQGTANVPAQTLEAASRLMDLGYNTGGIFSSPT